LLAEDTWPESVIAVGVPAPVGGFIVGVAAIRIGFSLARTGVVSGAGGGIRTESPAERGNCSRAG